MKKVVFKVSGKLKMFDMPSAWTYLPISFLDIPPVLPGGWGSVPVEATLGKTTWTTALFPLKKEGYFLPIKKLVLKNENLKVGDTVSVRYFAV